MNEHLMQKEWKAANEKSESNHYQFHAISLTSFSNISSIPISTRLKWKKETFFFCSSRFFNLTIRISRTLCMRCYIHTYVSWHVGEYLETNWEIMDSTDVHILMLYIQGEKLFRGKSFLFSFWETDGLVEWQIDKFSNLKDWSIGGLTSWVIGELAK